MNQVMTAIKTKFRYFQKKRNKKYDVNKTSEISQSQSP